LIGALIGLVALGAFTSWEHRLRPPLTGDEPAYLVMAESLRFDRDIDLSNNYGTNARIDSQLASPLAVPNNVHREASGALRPGQPVGMGLLLVPAVAIGHHGAAEVDWARRLMLLFAALLCWQLFMLLADHVSLGLAAAVTAGVALSLPVVGFSNQIYPEIPAALLLAIGLRAALRPAGARVLLAGLAAAPLPWLSIRFLPLAVGVAAAAIWRAAETETPTRWSWRRVAAGLGPLVVGDVLLAAIESGSLHAPCFVAQSPMNTYRVGVGGLFSVVYGVLPIAPQLVLGIAGLGLIALVHRSAAVLVGAVLVYEFVATPYGFRGYALPGRFQVVLVPVFALSIGLLLRVYPRAVPAFAALVVVGCIVLVEGGRQPTYGSLYRDGARPNVPAVRSAARVLPDFSLAPGHSGAVLRGSQLTRGEVALRRGRYDVTLRVRTPGAADAVIVVDAATPSDGEFARIRNVNEPVARDGTVRFTLPVDRSGTEYRFGVSVAPSTRAARPSLTIRAAAPVESRTAPSRRDLPLGVAWMLAAALSAVAVFVGARRREYPPGPDPVNEE
jgi:hypothetical protein